MTKRRIKTLVKYDHALGKNEYVFGRISGVMAVMCKDDPVNGLEFVRERCDIGDILTTDTTDEKYEAFTNVIKNWYAGLCIFDYVE